MDLVPSSSGIVRSRIDPLAGPDAIEQSRREMYDKREASVADLAGDRCETKEGGERLGRSRAQVQLIVRR